MKKLLHFYFTSKLLICAGYFSFSSLAGALSLPLLRNLTFNARASSITQLILDPHHFSKTMQTIKKDPDNGWLKKFWMIDFEEYSYSSLEKLINTCKLGDPIHSEPPYCLWKIDYFSTIQPEDTPRERIKKLRLWYEDYRFIHNQALSYIAKPKNVLQQEIIQLNVDPQALKKRTSLELARFCVLHALAHRRQSVTNILEAYNY